MKQTRDMASYVATAQGAYYVPTGIWALVSIGSFQRVTGPKTDLWLVKTVGVLVAVIGAVLLRAGRQRAVTVDSRLLAVGSAGGLTAIDLVYVAWRRIAPIYLLDALAEIVLMALWARVGIHGSDEPEHG